MPKAYCTIAHTAYTERFDEILFGFAIVAVQAVLPAVGLLVMRWAEPPAARTPLMNAPPPRTFRLAGHVAVTVVNHNLRR